jgi:hypothetical protein
LQALGNQPKPHASAPRVSRHPQEWTSQTEPEQYLVWARLPEEVAPASPVVLMRLVMERIFTQHRAILTAPVHSISQASSCWTIYLCRSTSSCIRIAAQHASRVTRCPRESPHEINVQIILAFLWTQPQKDAIWNIMLFRAHSSEDKDRKAHVCFVGCSTSV